MIGHCIGDPAFLAIGNSSVLADAAGSNKRAEACGEGNLPALRTSVIRLTYDKGTFLALLARVQPATAYQLSKIYAESPVSNFGTSKGKIYPMIRRLKERGLLSARALDDGRNGEVLRCTAQGKEAVRGWIKDIRPDHLLPEDPLRTMLQSFDLLSRQEQAEWIEAVRHALKTKPDELEQYGAAVHVPYHEQVHDNAVTTLISRLAWLDRVESSLRPDC